MDLIALDGVGKRYGDDWALRDVSLSCGPGVVGLLGPNGAGKTTLLRILATILRPDAGAARVGPDLVVVNKLVLVGAAVVLAALAVAAPRRQPCASRGTSRQWRRVRQQRMA